MSVRSYLSRLVYFQTHRVLKRWLPHPLGHFYSPICDVEALDAAVAFGELAGQAYTGGSFWIEVR